MIRLQTNIKMKKSDSIISRLTRLKLLVTSAILLLSSTVRAQAGICQLDSIEHGVVKLEQADLNPNLYTLIEQ